MVFYHHDLPPEGRPLPGGSLIINLVRIEVLERNFMKDLKILSSPSINGFTLRTRKSSSKDVNLVAEVLGNLVDINAVTEPCRMGSKSRFQDDIFLQRQNHIFRKYSRGPNKRTYIYDQK